jgi:uncharacterized protein with HEPN domain
MFDKNTAIDTIHLIIENIHIIQQRTIGIISHNDFTSTETGMMILDSICMKLAAIGECIKSLDKITQKELLVQYPQINWKLAMGMRDIIVHHYFDIDAEVIFKTLKEDIPSLFEVLEKMHLELLKSQQ